MIYESKLNYLSESELDEFKFTPVMPIYLSYNHSWHRWHFRIDNKTHIAQHKCLIKILEKYLKWCKENNQPLI